MAGLRRYGLRRLVAAIVCAAAVSAIADRAFARAGGGERYSGSSSGSSGGGGGSYSGGDSYSDGDGYDGATGDGELTTVEAILLGCMLIITAIVIIFAAIFAAIRGVIILIHRLVIRLADKIRKVRCRKELASVISKNDDDFRESVFYDRVRDAFAKIQQAWSEQRIEEVRAFVSDGIFERFSLQIQEQRDLGYRNVMESVRVREVAMADVDCDDRFETAAVKITASAVDYRVRLDDGREIPGFRHDESFTEYWSFIRRTGVKTQRRRRGLIEGFCPNCGTDIRMNRTARCESCNSLIRNGEYDWVLAEITQQCEWRASGSSKPLWVASYHQSRDEAFSLQCLEDRASVIFWRKVMADRLGETGPLRKMATPQFCDQYADTLRPKRRKYFGDCAVGCVQLLGILPSEEMDRSLVHIRWSGSIFHRFGGGQPVRQSGSVLHDSLFVLGRRSGVKTPPEYGLSSAHCPCCAAPEEKLTSHACEFCGEVLNDGSHDWVLLDIMRTCDPQARELIRLSRFVPRGDSDEFAENRQAEGSGDEDGIPQSIALLSWAIDTAMADGRIQDRERSMLKDVAGRHGMSERQLDALIDGTLRSDLYLPRPQDLQQAKRWLTVMADVGLADGRMRRAEHGLLRRVGAGLSMDDREVKKLVRERRKELYHEARAELRNAKKGNSSQSAAT